MFLYYQKDGYFVEYKITKQNKKFVKKYEKRIFKPLNFVLNKFFDKDDKFYFLLDEKNFSFYTFNVNIKTDKPFVLPNLKKIIEAKKNLIKTVFSEKRRLLYIYVDNIYIDGKKQYFLLGKKGNIFFDLRFVFVDRGVSFDFQRVGKERLFKYNVVRPKSLFTIKFLSEKLNKRNYLILYFFDDNVVLYQIDNGFYKKISSLNFGLIYLKKLFSEKQVKKLYYDMISGKEFGSVGEKIVDDILDFYFKMIFNWISNEIGNLFYEDLIVIGLNKFKSSKVLEKFLFYSNKIVKYILPFNYSLLIDKKVLNKNFDIDVKTFLFFKDK